MTITLARMEDMSLQHYIKDVVLPLKWAERVVNVPLVCSTARQRFEADVVWLPNFMDEGRGWVYFDPVGTDTYVADAPPSEEQTTRVVVNNEVGSAIAVDNYTVNYADGAITASGITMTPQGVPTTVDFTQYYVSVVDGWPGTDPPPAPIVAIDIAGFSKKGFQLGGGRKSIRRGVFHIFATSSAERDDLTEWLHDSIYNRGVSVQDWRGGEPLNYDGTFNTTFSGTLLQLSDEDDALFKFDNISVDYISVRQDWSDMNRWRSKISFDMTSYRDGFDFNVL